MYGNGDNCVTGTYKSGYSIDGIGREEITIDGKKPSYYKEMCIRDRDVILGRNGGDEFSIFMPDCTVVEVKPFLKKFTEETRKFYCKGEAHTSVSYTHLDVYKRQM